MRGGRGNARDGDRWHPAALAAALLALLWMGCTSVAPRKTVDEDAPGPSDANVVSAEEMEDVSQGTRPEELLQGRIAGVHVTTMPSGDVTVQIRGANFIQGNNEPLYVIDGLPTAPGPGGGLSGISVYDIESIRVLKGTAAMARYGKRGVNGVVVVETKRPPEPHE